jgi:signal transduction histidine kinase
MKMSATVHRSDAALGSSASLRPAAWRGAPLLAGVGLVLAAAVWAAISAAQRGDSDGVLAASLVTAWALAAATLGVRRRGEPMALVLLGGAALAVVAVGAAAVLARPSGVASGWLDLAHLAQPLALGLLPAAGMHVLAGLPSGRLGTRGRRALVAVTYLVGAAIGLALWTQRPDVPMWPIATEAALVALVGYSFSYTRYRRAAEAERRRLMWLGWAATVGGAVAVVAGAMHVLVSWPPNPVQIAAAATAPVPVAFMLGTSRRLLAGIDRILARTIALAGLSVLVVAVYFVVVLGLGRVPDQQEGGLLALSMAAAAVAALLHPPAQRRLARFANRCVYGERAQPDDTLRSFGSRMSRAVPMDELLLQMAESLQRSLGLAAVEVWTGSEGKLERTVSVPDRGPAQLRLGAAEEPVVVRAGVCGPAWLRIWLPTLLQGRDEEAPLRLSPIAHSGELLGLIVVERARGASHFNDDDDRLLTELARQAGLALHNLRLDSALQASLDEVRRQASELQASRLRIVTTADAERRRIERNLHDGAQQHLVALAVKMRLARQFVDRDLDRARSMLDQLGEDVTAAVDELRALAHGIYPPLLMDRGLVDALSAAARRAALPTEVKAGEVGRYAQEIEAAVYFCCLEAMQNAGKHAGDGATITVSVREEEGGLLFEVADDGAGFDVGAAGGLGAGFTNMGDRVGAIGGSVNVESAPGRGTRVYGRVPVEGRRTEG